MKMRQRRKQGRKMESMRNNEVGKREKRLFDKDESRLLCHMKNMVVV